jgi:uncharacterized protein YraI
MKNIVVAVMVLILAACGPKPSATPTLTVAPERMQIVVAQPMVAATSQPEPADLATTAAPPSPAPTITVAPPTVTSTIAPTLIPTPTSLPQLTATPAPATAGTANLRSGPGTDYPVVGALPAGQPLAIVASNQDRTWYQLADKRWVFGQLVSNAPTRVDVATVIPPPPAPTWTPSLPAAAPILPTWTAAPAAPVAPPARVCCRVCSAGKACGDTCISQSKTCNVGPGCACDG